MNKNFLYYEDYVSKYVPRNKERDNLKLCDVILQHQYYIVMAVSSPNGFTQPFVHYSTDINYRYCTI